MKKRIPHKKNIAGDFYVEYGCCTACDLPQGEAPEHFKYDENNHCYICKQPKNSEELNNIFSAMEVQEFDCIRYKGNEKAILEQIKEHLLLEYVD